MQISVVTIVVYAHSASSLIVLCVRAQSSFRFGWLFMISAPQEGEMVPFVDMEAVTLLTLEAYWVKGLFLFTQPVSLRCPAIPHT